MMKSFADIRNHNPAFFFLCAWEASTTENPIAYANVVFFFICHFKHSFRNLQSHCVGLFDIHDLPCSTQVGQQDTGGQHLHLFAGWLDHGDGV